LYTFLCSGTFLESEELVTRGSAGQSNISLTQSRNLEIPVPSIEEQREIVRRVKQILQGSSSLLTRLESASHLLDRVGESAVAKAFRGELMEEFA
jgi:type I restriction enzyme S subunit